MASNRARIMGMMLAGIGPGSTPSAYLSFYPGGGYYNLNIIVPNCRPGISWYQRLDFTNSGQSLSSDYVSMGVVPANGVLVYQSGPIAPTDLYWFNGNVTNQFGLYADMPGRTLRAYVSVST